jgi:hypothetical protein
VAAVYIDLGKFRAAPLQHDPFDHVMVPGFVRPDCLGAIEADYPPIDRAGNFALERLSGGPAFSALVAELTGPEFRDAVAATLDLPLDGLHTIVTVRAFVAPGDGKIHTDVAAKLATALVYMNADWTTPGGQLRLLRQPHDIDDYVVQVPPLAGTLLVFRRSDSSWHGWKRYAGPRRSIQINWATDAAQASKQYRAPSLGRRLRKVFSLGR